MQNVVLRLNGLRQWLTAVAILGIWLAAPVQAQVNYSCAVLNPLTPLSGDSGIATYSSVAGQTVGYGEGRPTGSSALLWSGPTGSVTNLLPTGVTFGVATNTDGAQQVGLGMGSSTGNYNHAFLWSGTAASAVDLNPTNLAGFSFSAAQGISGDQQVGFGSGSGTGGNHALLWTGTAASAVDLNPAEFPSSEANATDGTQQVGYGTDAAGNTHAVLWSGTAASAVDLTPMALTGFTNTVASGIGDMQQVGYGSGPGTTVGNNTFENDHALLWSGTAASAIDLNPAGFLSSEALGTNGIQQVGYGQDPTESGALVWSGTAASAVNLGLLLPAGGDWVQSFAFTIDAVGDIYGTAQGSSPSYRGYYAVEWSPVVPEPATFTLMITCTACLLLRRKKDHRFLSGDPRP